MGAGGGPVSKYELKTSAEFGNFWHILIFIYINGNITLNNFKIQKLKKKHFKWIKFNVVIYLIFNMDMTYDLNMNEIL